MQGGTFSVQSAKRVTAWAGAASGALSTEMPDMRRVRISQRCEVNERAHERTSLHVFERISEKEKVGGQGQGW